MHAKDKKSKKTLLVVLLATLIVLIGGYFTYAAVSKQAWPFQNNQSESINTSNDTINYAPPTEQEVADSQNGKKNSAQQENQKPTGNVSVGIAFAGYDDQEGLVDIRAFTADVIEGNGTCTATLSRNTQTIVRSSKAFVDSTSTQCEPIKISPNDFPQGGTWNLVVTYESSSSKGTSAQSTIEVTK